jgi:flagellar biosynthesis chaperone FliJ
MKDTVGEELRRLEEEEEQIELSPHEDEYDFLLKIVRSTRQPMSRRMRAAIEALPYKRPKLGAVATAQMSGQDFASLLEKAIQRSSMTPEQLRQAQQLRFEGGKWQIEAQATDVEKVGR